MRSRNPLWLAALLATLLAPQRAGAQAAPSPLCLSAEVVGEDVYRLVVTEPGTASGEPAVERESAHTLLRAAADGSELVVTGRDSPDSLPLWRGRVERLAQVGHAGVPGLQLIWTAGDDERLHGLGQRFDGWDLNGRRVEMWIRDAPGQEEGATYFCTPVLFSSRGYALFAGDNPDGVFDLNTRGDGRHRYARAGVGATCYLAFAPTLKELVLKRARIQGPFRSIPDWAWGPWISRNSYENQAEAEAALRGMLQRDLPVSAIVQEAWKGTSETGDFNNFSADRWPRLDAYLDLCSEYDIKNILWQVPIIHPSSPAYADAAARGFFVKDPAGGVSSREAWLAGFANIDFTNPDAVAWWKDRLRGTVRKGVWGFKADDGEAIKPDDLFSDGRRGWAVHNEYSTLYNKALTELLDEEHVDGLLWARSGSLGLEQVPALWAGDQYARWDQYRSLIPAGLSASLSGMPFWGHDIGGYIGDPGAELYIRWLQFGAFSPLMQYHGIEPREPWEFGAIAERAYHLLAHLRMNLRPTLIALGREAARTGMPIMRPMTLAFPDDPRFVDEVTQYMLGPDLLVAPVLEAGAPGRSVKFPAGTWQHLLEPVSYTGPNERFVPLGLVSAPVFVREGATLDVELDEDARLGAWHRGAPVRKLTFSPDRVRTRNPAAHASAIPLSWRLAGPFPIAPGRDQHAAGQLDGLAEERNAASPTNIFPVAAGTGLLDLQHLLGPADHAFAYARASVVSDRRQDAILSCASDDGIIIWLNGKKIVESYDLRPFRPGQHLEPVELAAGTNILFCRIGQAEGEWKFQVQLRPAAALPSP